jgi:predicted RNase H-like HicB family nuclease
MSRGESWSICMSERTKPYRLRELADASGLAYMTLWRAAQRGEMQTCTPLRPIYDPRPKQKARVVARLSYTHRMIERIIINAFWDDDASVWVAESEDVPGLVAEAESLEALSAKLERLIPELLELNRVTATHSEIRLVATRALHYAL